MVKRNENEDKRRKTQGRIIETTIRGNCKKILDIDGGGKGKGRKGFFSECGESCKDWKRVRREETI
jgi:hypothetical protein